MSSPRWLRGMSRLVRYRTLSKSVARVRKRQRKASEFSRKFESERWQRDASIARRQYASYEEYLEHQASKLGQVFDRRKAKDREALGEFRRRFETCDALQGRRTVLCLGARLGTEVEALHDLGFFAVGVDLEPGPGNQRVLVGDFHELVFPDASTDAVYTNTLDHVFDLARVMQQAARILRPDGVLIADVVPGFDEGFTPGEYESSHWRSIEELIDEIERGAALKHASTRDLGDQGRDRWSQLVFRRTAGDATGGTAS